MNKKLLAVVLCVLLLATLGIGLYLTRPQPRKLRLQVGFGVHYSQLVIAVEKGFIEKYIPDVTIELTTSFTGPEKLEAMTAKRLDFGMMGVPPAIVGNIKMPVKILAAQGVALRGIYTWREDINSLDDFVAGDKINTGGFGTTQYVSLVKYFTEQGLSKDDVDKMVVSFKFPDSFQLMEQREIDAEFSTGQWNWNYIGNPDYKCLLTEGDIWEMAGLVFVGREEYAEANPDIVEALLKGYIEATDFINTNPTESLQIVADFYGWDEPTSYEGFSFDYTYGLEAIPEISGVMHELGLVDKAVTLDEVLFELVRDDL